MSNGINDRAGGLTTKGRHQSDAQRKRHSRRASWRTFSWVRDGAGNRPKHLASEQRRLALAGINFWDDEDKKEQYTKKK